MEKEKRISVTDQVVAALRREILKGTYSPGEKLPAETTLSEMFDVGRSTIREVLRTLQAMGYVELKPSRGAFVASGDIRTQAEKWFTINENTLENFRELRYMVEPESAHLAAVRHSEEDMAILKDLTDRFNALSRQYIETGDRGLTPHLTRLDEQFHTHLIRISGNLLLLQLYEQISPLFQQYSIRSFTLSPDGSREADKEHRTICLAVLSGDGEKARDAMKKHLASAEDKMESFSKKS